MKFEKGDYILGIGQSHCFSGRVAKIVDVKKTPDSYKLHFQDMDVAIDGYSYCSWVDREFVLSPEYMSPVYQALMGVKE